MRYIKNRLTSVITRVKTLFFSPQKYWNKRAKKYGVRSVLNLNHTESDISSITNYQITTLFPLLERELNGTEKTILDFGCGPGRFTVQLAELINGKAIGIDSTPYLLSIAPMSARVEYRHSKNKTIPVESNSIDIIWICLVLGGILNEKHLKYIIKELYRVSRKDSLVFLVENTTNKKDILTWKYRSKEYYTTIFKDFNLSYVDGYKDLDEEISIFIGRKPHNE